MAVKKTINKIEKQEVAKKRLAITIGCFDMLHEGHINLLRKMKEEAELVYIFLHNNTSIFENKGKFPVQNDEDRANNLLLCKLVNKVFYIHNADPSGEFKNTFEMVIKRRDKVDPKDTIYFRGDDWIDFPGRKAVEDLGIEIKIVEYTKGVSSTKIRDEINKK